MTHSKSISECVECVGCSNNTIRAALTPKFIDREALIEVLNYRMTDPEFYLVPPQQLKNFPNVIEYAPDCKDFTLHEIQISKTSDDGVASSSAHSTTTLPSLECASIMVIVEGEAICDSSHALQGKLKNVRRGDIFYIPAKRTVKVTPSSEHFLAYRTFSHEIGPDHSNRKITSTIELQQQLQRLSPILPMRKKASGAVSNLKLKETNYEQQTIFDLDSDMDGLC